MAPLAYTVKKARDRDAVPEIVLASSSPYRRALLARLGLPFAAHPPRVEEAPQPGEAPEALVQRLALAKARALELHHPEALIIGSDQVAVLDGHVLGKPGEHAAAVAQLKAASGRRVRFHTGLCLLNAATGRRQLAAVPFDVVFRPLSTAQIEGYLRREQPYDCAGSFKSEGLGIALFQRLEGEDPTALEGLPLIRLVAMLEAEGVAVL